MDGLDITTDPHVITGMAGAEDAGVYQLSEGMALVQTLDFFTPIVDDPRDFGRIAAANSLSDVWAMGGRPITAMNIVCFPPELGMDVLHEILAGGLDILREAGVALVGGHSIKDKEPKYGLSVTGLVDPAKLMTNDGLRPGDRLVLTKPVGTGVISTALKQGKAGAASVDASMTAMKTLNRAAAEIATRHGLRAATDVTGFGLLGHLCEMLEASGCAAHMDAAAVPLLPGALDAARAGLVPGGSKANQTFFGGLVAFDPAVSEPLQALLFDAQTSGGLVLAVPDGKLADVIAQAEASCLAAAEIGVVTASTGGARVKVR